jgi:hypothetical protein
MALQRTVVVVALALVSLGGTPARAGGLDRLRTLMKERLDRMGKYDRFGRRVEDKDRRMGYGPQHSFDPHELKTSTMRMTSRQFKMGKGGAIVAVKTLFRSFRPNKVDTQSVELEEEQRRQAALRQEQVKRTRLQFERFEGQRIFMTNASNTHFGERFVHKINRMKDAFVSWVDRSANRFGASQMVISLADMQRGGAQLALAH